MSTGIRCLEALQHDTLVLRGRFDKDRTLKNVPPCTEYTCFIHGGPRLQELYMELCT